MHAVLISVMPRLHITALLVLFVAWSACLARQPQCSVRATLASGTAEGLPGACDRGVCWIKYTMEGIPLSDIFIFNSFARFQGGAFSQS